MTGASGAIYALDFLRRFPGEKHVILSKWAKMVLHTECGVSEKDLEPLAKTILPDHDLSAQFASGSIRHDACVVIPASASTVGKIAAGIGDTLVTRAAQVALKEGHGVESTEKVPLEKVPEFLRTTWAARATEGVVALGLQDDYALLAALGDDIGKTFQEAGLSGTKSPLVARNRSILAHGFERVTDAVFTKLWTSALSLANVDAASLPSFPELAGGRS